MPNFVLDSATALARANAMDRSFLAPLRPVLIGPKAGLHRFAVTAEQASLGAFDPLADTTYDYPDLVSGSTVDLTTVLLFADDVRLNYFNKYIGTNGSSQPSSTYPNRVRAANYIFKTANTYTRSSDFGDRDVKVGDVVQVRGTVSSVPTTLTTVVTGFVGEPVAAVTAAATADAANQATQTLAAAVTQVTGTPINDVVAVTSGAAYESSADGYVTRTYTVTVTTSSTGGNATTGRLRVRSADGLDDVDDVVPAAFGSATAIGTKGLTGTFSISPSQSSSSLYGIDEDDFVVGQQWTFTVSQAFTAPVATSAGTYTGTRDDNYIVTVTRGGLYSSGTLPQITVTTANGSDSSGPTDVTATATAVAVGNYNVTVQFSQTKLRKNDVYYITVTAAAEGAVKTLVLRDDVPVGLRGTETDLRLFASRSGVSIPLTRTLPSNATNWSFDADGVTVESGIYLTDSEFTTNGVAFGVPLDSATLFVEYREWLIAGGAEIVRVATRDAVEGLLGTVDPLNPIAYAADIALKNTYTTVVGDANTTASTTTDVVYAVAIGGDPADTSLWSAALEAVESDEQIYDLVLLTTDAAIQTLGRTHVLAQSDNTEGFYRRLFVPAVLNETAAIVAEGASVDDLTVTGTIAATTGTSPTKYTTVTASANAGFVTAGVRAGDVYRTSYGTDSLGVDTYSSYVIDAVISETTLRLKTGPTAAITVARRGEVWRTYTRAEMVTQLTGKALALKSDRVYYVWPDRVSLGGDTLDGFYVCAAVVGLAGSLPSHQGLRNVEIQGIDDATRSSRLFTSGHLAELGAGGVFVVSQQPTGEIYVRSAVSTDTTDIATREEMLMRNADMLRKGVQAAWAPYVGAGNNVSDLRPLFDGALQRMVARLKSGTYAAGLGAPLSGMNLTELTTVTGSPDTVQVTVTTTGTAIPLNVIQLNLPIVIG